jgi:Fic family protein
MAAREGFLYRDDDAVPQLLGAGLAHVQVESIHPFRDGNGRVGRLLITLLLHHRDILREPLLYLKRNRATYYALLDEVRREGDWEAWVAFFLTGVRETAGGAVSIAQQPAAMFQHGRNRIKPEERRARSALRVHAALKARPIVSLSAI